MDWGNWYPDNEIRYQNQQIQKRNKQFWVKGYNEITTRKGENMLETLSEPVLEFSQPALPDILSNLRVFCDDHAFFALRKHSRTSHENYQAM